MNHLNALVFALIVIFTPAGASAEEKTGADPAEGLKLKPHMMDAKSGTGSVLGLDFEYKRSGQNIAPFERMQSGRSTGDKQDAGVFGSPCGGYAEEQGKVIPTWVAFTDCAGEISARGTLAANAAKNPNKLLDFSGSYSWMHIRSERPATRMFSIGGQAKYETDQSFENKQFVAGLRGTFTYLAGCNAQGAASCEPKLDFLGISAAIQRVNPTTDSTRKAALSGGPLDNYQRGEFEVFYKYNLPKDWNYVSDVELNYRHFQELSPPDLIRQAGLDRQRLGLIRLNFGLAGKGSLATTPKMFVQYSSGKLPFDTKSDRVVKIGLTYDIF